MAIIYEGPSMIDGAPVVVLTTEKSTNRKTGAMLQTFIVRQDVRPTDALKNGADSSVCGDCPHRPSNHGACYVTVGHGPLSTWKRYQAGGHEVADPVAIGAGKDVRLGTYGDPAAVPTEVWERLVSGARTVTGYTHQWRSADPRLAALCMASTDTPEESREAQDAGWRTFRIRLATEARAPGEAICPASEEAGHKLQCADCGACDGHRTGRRGRGVTIINHGSKARRYVEFRATVA